MSQSWDWLRLRNTPGAVKGGSLLVLVMVADEVASLVDIPRGHIAALTQPEDELLVVQDSFPEPGRRHLRSLKERFDFREDLVCE
jgi:hypothetical protein